jgi:hypothetical protein
MAKSGQEITSPEPAPGATVSATPPTDTEIHAAFIVEHCKRALAARTTPPPLRAFIEAVMTLPPPDLALVLSSFMLLRMPLPAPPEPPLPPAPEEQEDPQTARAAADYDALLRHEI